MALSGATTPVQSGPGSNGNYLTIRLLIVLTRTLIGGGSYPSADMQSMHSTTPADSTIFSSKVVMASMSMHTELNICATTKQVIFPH